MRVNSLTSLHRGKQSMAFPNRPVITAWASVVGKKEGDGPLGRSFDLVIQDGKFGEKTWEQAETHFQQTAIDLMLKKRGPEAPAPELVFSGDLLNQCVGSSYALRGSGLPALGLYGACSTMAEGLLLAGAAVNAGYVRQAVALSSSHFAAAERQYRFPLAYGGQRTPTAQWTVTGAGAVLASAEGKGPVLTEATVGTVEDKGITDANNMGAAMAWAAYRTIRANLEDLGRSPEDYDRIITGDLGSLGSDMVREFFAADGVRLGQRYTDCGVLIYDPETQDVHCGGSGAGCSATVLAARLLPGLAAGQWKRILFCGTGALLSPTTVQQKRSIPAVCHAVAIEH
ncbi:MAG: stage V sporulation protein AD [Oscillospiraceae bacterium]|nr:stage V sporulation protein AD [Oscillospiraceae bacterium]